MFRKTNDALLLRLLRLAANKDGPEAKAASLLQGWYSKYGTESSSLLSKAPEQATQSSFWQAWDLSRHYGKVRP